jgi:beta-glucanase (GH16 family)
MEVILDGVQSTKMIVRISVCRCHSVNLVILLTFFTRFCFKFSLAADTNAALHYYSSDNVVTTNGVLNITVNRKVNNYKAFDEKKKTFYADKKYVQSGMVQSWNKFCFIGGIVEFSAKLPGSPQKGGLWPARKYTHNKQNTTTIQRENTS